MALLTNANTLTVNTAVTVYTAPSQGAYISYIDIYNGHNTTAMVTVRVKGVVAFSDTLNSAETRQYKSFWKLNSDETVTIQAQYPNVVNYFITVQEP